LDSDFFGEGKVVVFRVFPVDEPDGLVLVSSAFFVFDAIAQESIDFFVGIVKVFAFADGSSLVEFAKGFVDEGVGDALLFEPLGEDFGFDVAVVVTGFPVAGVATLVGFETV
jgi:hypothetical protein